MTDKEKIDLIGKMISEFWECIEPEELQNSAITMLTAVGSVVDFNEVQV